MKTSDREAQILRIQSASFQPELSTALAAKLRQAVVGVTKATLEAALVGRTLSRTCPPPRTARQTLRILFTGTRYRAWSHREAPATTSQV